MSNCACVYDMARLDGRPPCESSSHLPPDTPPPASSVPLLPFPLSDDALTRATVAADPLPRSSPGHPPGRRPGVPQPPPHARPPGPHQHHRRHLPHPGASPRPPLAAHAASRVLRAFCAAAPWPLTTALLVHPPLALLYPTAGRRAVLRHLLPRQDGALPPSPTSPRRLLLPASSAARPSPPPVRHRSKPSPHPRTHPSGLTPTDPLPPDPPQVRLWDARNPSSSATIGSAQQPAHGAFITAIDCRDGAHVATGASDGTVALWRAENSPGNPSHAAALRPFLPQHAPSTAPGTLTHCFAPSVRPSAPHLPPAGTSACSPRRRSRRRSSAPSASAAPSRGSPWRPRARRLRRWPPPRGCLCSAAPRRRRGRGPATASASLRKGARTALPAPLPPSHRRFASGREQSLPPSPQRNRDSIIPILSCKNNIILISISTSISTGLSWMSAGTSWTATASMPSRRVRPPEPPDPPDPRTPCQSGSALDTVSSSFHDLVLT